VDPPGPRPRAGHAPRRLPAAPPAARHRDRLRGRLAAVFDRPGQGAPHQGARAAPGRARLCCCALSTSCCTAGSAPSAAASAARTASSPVTWCTSPTTRTSCARRRAGSRRTRGWRSPRRRAGARAPARRLRPAARRAHTRCSTASRRVASPAAVQLLQRNRRRQGGAGTRERPCSPRAGCDRAIAPAPRARCRSRRVASAYRRRLCAGQPDPRGAPSSRAWRIGAPTGGVTSSVTRCAGGERPVGEAVRARRGELGDQRLDPGGVDRAGGWRSHAPITGPRW